MRTRGGIAETFTELHCDHEDVCAIWAKRFEAARETKGGRRLTNKELSQLYWLNSEIVEEKRKLDELETAASNCTAKITGLPHASGTSTKIENYAILIAEQRELIDAKVKQSIIEYNRLNRYIASIDDCLMRQILSLRYVNGFSWFQVATHIGGGNTEDSVRMACQRYLQTH